jgi:hypothetical protein
MLFESMPGNFILRVKVQIEGHTKLNGEPDESSLPRVADQWFSITHPSWSRTEVGKRASVGLQRSFRINNKSVKLDCAKIYRAASLSLLLRKDSCYIISQLQFSQTLKMPCNGCYRSRRITTLHSCKSRISIKKKH